MRKSLVSAVKGCLVGGAAGDALGYAIEFDKEKSIFGEYGARGITSYALTDGKAQISDDTQMTLCTAWGILHTPKGEYALPGIYRAYHEWAMYQRGQTPKTPIDLLRDHPEMRALRAPGLTCLQALMSGKCGTTEEPINNSKGCGGIMRVAPAAFICGDAPTEEDLRRAAMLGADAAAITHGHPLGYYSAAAHAYLCAKAAYAEEGTALANIVSDCAAAMRALFPDGFGEKTAKLLEDAMTLAAGDMSDLDGIHALGEGWVGEEAMAIAVFCCLRHASDFDAAIIAAVNHKGDSDSTGAIAGNLLGAYLGYEAVGEKWRNDLELLDVLEATAEALVR